MHHAYPLLLAILGTVSFAINVSAQNEVAGTLVEYSTPVGSPAILPSNLYPYQSAWTWLQLDDIETSDQFGQFLPYAEMEEFLKQNVHGDWLHTQITRYETGEIITAERRFDGNTLQLRDLTVVSNNGNSGFSVLELNRSRDGYTGSVEVPDGDLRRITYPTEVPIFSGYVAGLVIKSLPLAIGYRASLPTGVAHSRTSYKLWIEVTGEEMVDIGGGREISAWVVETGWLDLSTGDTYRQGADGKGGVFYISKGNDQTTPIVIDYISSQTRITYKRDPTP